MSEMYNGYCMKFSNEEIRKLFCNKFSEEIRSQIIYIAEDGGEADLESGKKIETIAFDKEENISIMFLGHQTSIFAYNQEIMFIDEASRESYTISDVYGNVVYEGKMREMSHEEMLDFFSKIILCFIGSTGVHVTQLDVPPTSGYQKHNYFDAHIYIINIDNGHANRQSPIFENITIYY